MLRSGPGSRRFRNHCALCIGPGSAACGCNPDLTSSCWVVFKKGVCVGNFSAVADLILPLLPTASCCRQQKMLLTLSSWYLIAGLGFFQMQLYFSSEPGYNLLNFILFRARRAELLKAGWTSAAAQDWIFILKLKWHLSRGVDCWAKWTNRSNEHFAVQQYTCFGA